MSALGGYMIDRVGVKRGLGISLAVWSAASAAHAWARSVVWIGAARFLLGIGEGACFPAATRGATEYAAPESRSFATGIAIGGSALGAVIAPPLTVLIAAHYGWRGAFLFTGVIGFVWCLLWFIAVPGRKATAAPLKHARLSRAVSRPPPAVDPRRALRLRSGFLLLHVLDPAISFERNAAFLSLLSVTSSGYRFSRSASARSSVSR